MAALARLHQRPDLPQQKPIPPWDFHRRKQCCAAVYEACTECIRPNPRESAGVCRPRFFQWHRREMAQPKWAMEAARSSEVLLPQPLGIRACDKSSAKWVPLAE